MENCKIDLNKRIITFNRLSNEKIVNAFTLKPFDFSNNGNNIIIDSNNEIKTNNNNYNNNNCVKYQYNNCIKSQDNDLKNILGINLTTSKIIKPVQKQDRKSTRLNSSHTVISYAVFCLKKTVKPLPLF